jgi:hypothetical protein
VQSVPEAQEDAEPECFAVPLRLVLPKHRREIAFVVVDGVCVFDKRHPQLWLDWWEARAAGATKYRERVDTGCRWGGSFSRPVRARTNTIS